MPKEHWILRDAFEFQITTSGFVIFPDDEIDVLNDKLKYLEIKVQDQQKAVQEIAEGMKHNVTRSEFEQKNDELMQQLTEMKKVIHTIQSILRIFYFTGFSHVSHVSLQPEHLL